MSENKIYLVLQNGQVFEGESFGARRELIGEIVFTTGMTGYLETLTDPSYYGQIVTQTFPLIGNYGVIPEDFESEKPVLKAYVVREICQHPSNFRSKGKLKDFLRENGIVGISGVDTRELTKTVREWGVMNAKIVFPEHLEQVDFEEIRNYRVKDAVMSVTHEAREVPAHPERYRVVLWDFGAKGNIVRELVNRGCTVKIVPAKTTFKEIAEYAPDGVMLGNGPGDPAENTEIIREIGKLLKSGIPAFGICLGHQLMALAAGAKTEKLKYGHRGANQPVRDVRSGRVSVTSQNHGYTVVAKSLPKHLKVSHVNVNDGTVEGIEYEGRPVFSVQFHPEACGGPLDTRSLFDKFIDNIREGL